MQLFTLSRRIAAVLGFMLTAGASAMPDPIVSYLQPLGAGAGNIFVPVVSPDGRYIAFRQDNPSGSASDIYLYDRVGGTTTQVNLTLAGAAPVNAKCDLPMPSNDALYVVFACNGVQMGVAGSQLANMGQSYFLYDRVRNKTEVIAQGSLSAIIDLTNPIAISTNGQYTAYRTRQSNGGYSLTIRNMTNKTSQVVAATSTYVGQQLAPINVSQDGRYVTYPGRPVASSLNTDLIVFDRNTGVSELINVTPAGVHGNGSIEGDMSLSEDGNFVAFYSDATNLVVPNPAVRARSIYLRDRSTGKTELISGKVGTVYIGPSLSADGRYVCWPGSGMVFVYDRLTRKTRSLAAPLSSNMRLSSDGRYLVYLTNQVPGSTGRGIVVVDFGARPGLTLSANSLSLTEGGAAGTYSAVLAQAPDFDVNVALSTNAQLSLARSQLTFTPSNWSVPQIVSVQAVQDGVIEGLHSATVTNTASSSDVEYSVIKPVQVTVAISDAVVPTLVLPGATWSRTDLPLSGTAAAGATVMLTATNRNTGWLTSVSAVADAQGRWSDTLTGLSDGVIEFDVQADGVHGAPQTITVALPPTFTDVTGGITTTAASMGYNRSTGKYAGDFILTNTGGAALAGPLQLQLNKLSAGIALSNATGSHGGAPYITVTAGLAPGASVTIPLVFDNPARGGIGYDAKIFSGSF